MWLCGYEHFALSSLKGFTANKSISERENSASHSDLQFSELFKVQDTTWDMMFIFPNSYIVVTSYPHVN